MVTAVRHLYFDYETFVLEPALLAPPVVVASWAWDDGPVHIQHANPACADQSLPLLDTLLAAAMASDVVIVAHNAAFEVIVTMARDRKWTPFLFGKLRRGEIHCTMVREKLLRIAKGDRTEGFALDDCCDQYGIPKPDKESPWRLRYGTLWNTPLKDFPPDALAYSLGDICVRDLYWAQEKIPQAKTWLVDQHHQVRAAVALQLTSARGFQTDPDAAAVLLAETEVKLAEYQETVLREGLARIEKKGVVKTKAAAEARIIAAYARQGRDAPRGEPTAKMIAAWCAENPEDADDMNERELKATVPGNISLDAEACELSGDPVLLAYTRFSQASTLRSKVRRLAHSPIQTSYNVLVATGRTSSRQGDDPEPGEPWVAYGAQVQNLPRVGAEVDDG